MATFFFPLFSFHFFFVPLHPQNKKGRLAQLV